MSTSDYCFVVPVTIDWAAAPSSDGRFDHRSVEFCRKTRATDDSIDGTIYPCHALTYLLAKQENSLSRSSSIIRQLIGIYLRT